MITSLKPNQIFVFGSNIAGKHMGGAALYAKEHFGALEGFGRGWYGQSYAFPTLDENFQKRDRIRLESTRDHLYKVAKNNPDKEFLMTAVGTGIAGYSHKYMKSLFVNAPKNVILPLEWLDDDKEAYDASFKDDIITN